MYLVISIMCIVLALIFVCMIVCFLTVDFPLRTWKATAPASPQRAPVDIVISWAGPNDCPRRLLERSEYNLRPYRYRDMGELAFCLFTLDKFASGIRTIHIVIPDTCMPHPTVHSLKQKHQPRVVFVADTAIMPPGALPTFNSHAIEANLDRIPNLSASFYYSCDDMFLTAPLDPTEAFSYALINDKNIFLPTSSDMHERAWTNNTRLIWERYGRQRDVYRPQHVMTLLSKRGYQYARHQFQLQFMQTTYSRVRNVHNIHPTGLVQNLDAELTFVKDSSKACLFMTVTDNALHNRIVRNWKVLTQSSVKYGCINDQIDDDKNVDKVSRWVHKNFHHPLGYTNELKKVERRVTAKK